MSGKIEKLSPVQAEIMRLVRDEGWELGFSAGVDVRVWMQKGGLCRGGEARSVSSATLHFLEDKGYIQRVPRKKDERYWLVRYELVKTEKEH